MNELLQFFAQGDADLRATAGEKAVLVRRDGERVALTAVISPAEVAYTMQRANGPVLTCDRVAVISREDAVRAPKVGDYLEAGGQSFEVVRVTGWVYDTSWHLDLALRVKPVRIPPTP